jgi:hypothetical protein
MRPVKTSKKQLALVRDWEKRNPERAQARKNAWAQSPAGKKWLAKNQKKKNRRRDAWRKAKRAARADRNYILDKRRIYLSNWRQRLRVESRCHDCGGTSDFNHKKGKPFYYCLTCRNRMREWQKLIMRKRRRWGIAK